MRETAGGVKCCEGEGVAAFDRVRVGVSADLSVWKCGWDCDDGENKDQEDVQNSCKCQFGGEILHSSEDFLCFVLVASMNTK